MTSGTHDDGRPGVIHARPVPHPGRWVGVVVIGVLIAMLVSSFVTNPNWDLPTAVQIMIQQSVIEGLIYGTLLGTVGSMILGVVLGLLLAVMRLSPNPVLRAVSFAYTWFFRAIPRYVLLGSMGSGLTYLYHTMDIGLPFGQQIAQLFHLSSDLTIATLDIRDISNTIIIGILGLGLSEAAYIAEIARAGMLSVDKGQTEAAQALGMSRGKTMRRIVLPQAMRVIIPPTGNETIAMVKDTSLLAAVPVNTELYFRAQAIGNFLGTTMAYFVAATAWYLIVCSVLMVGQHYMERYFGRGFGEPKSAKAPPRVPAGGEGG